MNKAYKLAGSYGFLNEVRFFTLLRKVKGNSSNTQIQNKSDKCPNRIRCTMRPVMMCKHNVRFGLHMQDAINTLPGCPVHCRYVFPDCCVGM